MSEVVLPGASFRAIKSSPQRSQTQPQSSPRATSDTWTITPPEGIGISMSLLKAMSVLATPDADPATAGVRLL